MSVDVSVKEFNRALEVFLYYFVVIAYATQNYQIYSISMEFNIKLIFYSRNHVLLLLRVTLQPLQFLP